MNDRTRNWLAPSALIISILTLLLVGALSWQYWQDSQSETHDLTVRFVTRLGGDTYTEGDACGVFIDRGDVEVSAWSDQLVIKNGSGEIVGFTSVNGGEVKKSGSSFGCVKEVVLTVEDSDFYSVEIFGWLHRVFPADALKSANWTIEMYPDE